MDEPSSTVNETMYRGIIGSLLYLTVSKLDIVFSVCLCVGFQSNPKESHMKAAKRILRYLKGTQDLVLYYPSGDNFDLIGYADTDYARLNSNWKIIVCFLSACPYYVTIPVLLTCPRIQFNIRKQNTLTCDITFSETMLKKGLSV
ncbi:putative mitochondrial protein AtMg00240 [Nicotiana tabacum]|uniref:Mitochondrial protein AtMg00240 n=1 Tax=Nicotiana tabacum TaxID=4097 RepID=A0AC58RUH9_TOBAC